MAIHFRETPDRIIISFTDAKLRKGESADHVLLEICEHAAEVAKRLTVDFRGVQFMSSAMIGVLVLLNKMAKQNSLDLRIANIGPNVREVFKITRLNKVLRFDDDDDPDLLGAPVPLPKPPSTDGGQAEPPLN